MNTLQHVADALIEITVSYNQKNSKDQSINLAS